jgi:hypothetical protein
MSMTIISMIISSRRVLGMLVYLAVAAATAAGGSSC